MCVFNPKAQFPAVIENVNVVQTVNFLGGALAGPGWEPLGNIIDFFATMTLQWLPSFYKLSIPTLPQKLWEAFYKAMTTEYKTEKKRKKKGLDLGSPNINKFQIIMNKETNQ